jgi:hypothetical protein
VGAIPRILYHYTDAAGFKAIVSQKEWLFRASRPPGGHPRGAYFTTKSPDTPNLATRLGIPAEKTAHYFSFEDRGDLTPLPGGRGAYVFFSIVDYRVEYQRQREFR